MKRECILNGEKLKLKYWSHRNVSIWYRYQHWYRYYRYLDRSAHFYKPPHTTNTGDRLLPMGRLLKATYYLFTDDYILQMTLTLLCIYKQAASWNHLNSLLSISRSFWMTLNPWLCLFLKMKVIFGAADNSRQSVRFWWFACEKTSRHLLKVPLHFFVC